MRKISIFVSTLCVLLLLGGCAGINYFAIETREPAQVALPDQVKSILIVNNVVQQPADVGHKIKLLRKTEYENTRISSDSVALFYTEALAQFMGEEGYFDEVKYLERPLRTDNNFWQEMPILPEQMNQLRNNTQTDAIISLDKLIVETDKNESYRQEGYNFSDLTARISSVIRVYLPSMEGRIPAVQYNDSLRWEGFDIQDNAAIAEYMLPSTEEAMKELAVRAAEKMTVVFSPHWIQQDRWYYTLSKSKMREGEKFAKSAQWQNAINSWTQFYNAESNQNNQAKAAGNIALGYEMLGDMDNAYEWAVIAENLFRASTANNSLDRRRAALYKNEIERRKDTSNQLNMQLH